MKEGGKGKQRERKKERERKREKERVVLDNTKLDISLVIYK